MPADEEEEGEGSHRSRCCPVPSGGGLFSPSGLLCPPVAGTLPARSRRGNWGPKGQALQPSSSEGRIAQQDTYLGNWEKSAWHRRGSCLETFRGSCGF